MVHGTTRSLNQELDLAVFILRMAKLRAVENRAGIAISANTGISGIINPIGEVTHKIQYDKQEVIKGEVFLNNKVTFYSMYGNIFSKVCFLLSIVCYVLIRLNRS